MANPTLWLTVFPVVLLGNVTGSYSQVWTTAQTRTMVVYGVVAERCCCRSLQGFFGHCWIWCEPGLNTGLQTAVGLPPYLYRLLATANQWPG